MSKELRDAVAILEFLGDAEHLRKDFNTPEYRRQRDRERREFDDKVWDAYVKICERKGWP